VALSATATAAAAHPVIRMADELIRLNARLRSVFAGVTATTGLAPMELTVLTAVTEARAAPTVAQIGRGIGHPRQVIQRAANALVAAGLIETAANPSHRRAPVLHPTAAGRALKARADGLALEAADSAMRELGAARCERLAAELHELRARIEAHLRRSA
jgi:DNA-binding MarR family transcriptional regulator